MNLTLIAIYNHNSYPTPSIEATPEPVLKEQRGFCGLFASFSNLECEEVVGVFLAEHKHGPGVGVEQEVGHSVPRPRDGD